MMKYKVTNRLEAPVRYNDILFAPQETKVLDEKPNSDIFSVEEVEEKEEPKKTERRKK